MKTIVQLLIVALVLNACVRGGMASWRYIQFKDAVTQMARFSAAEPAGELQERVLALAAEHGIELDPADLEIFKDGTRTTVSAAYFEYIELVPSLYTREHLFEIDVDVRMVRPLTPDDLK